MHKPNGVICVILFLAYLVQYLLARDRRTDNIYHASMVLHVTTDKKVRMHCVRNCFLVKS